MLGRSDFSSKATTFCLSALATRSLTSKVSISCNLTFPWHGTPPMSLATDNFSLLQTASKYYTQSSSSNNTYTDCSNEAVNSMLSSSTTANTIASPKSQHTLRDTFLHAKFSYIIYESMQLPLASTASTHSKTGGSKSTWRAPQYTLPAVRTGQGMHKERVKVRGPHRSATT